MSWSLEIDDKGSVLLHTNRNDTLLTGTDMKHLADALNRLRSQRFDMGVPDSQ